MPEVPSTGLACPVQVWQRGLAMDMVYTAIHDASDQPFKGMDHGLAAPDTGVCHGALLDLVTRYCTVFTMNNTLFLSIMIFLYHLWVTYGERMTKKTTAPASSRLSLSKATTPAMAHHCSPWSPAVPQALVAMRTPARTGEAWQSTRGHRQILPRSVNSASLVPALFPACLPAGPTPRARLPSWGRPAHLLR
jgi:hypothetical protein